MISTTYPMKNHTSRMFECHLPFISVINLIVSLPIRRSQGAFMNVSLLTTRFFDMVTFNTVTPLSLLSSWERSFPAVSLKIPSLSFALISPNRIFMRYLRMQQKTYSNSSSTVSFESSLLSRVDACTFRAISYQQPLSIIYDILSLNHSTLLTADTVL